MGRGSFSTGKQLHIMKNLETMFRKYTTTAQTNTGSLLVRVAMKAAWSLRQERLGKEPLKKCSSSSGRPLPPRPPLARPRAATRGCGAFSYRLVIGSFIA